MSTRATYTIGRKDIKLVSHNYYIHYDGYAEGAAEYFKNMLLVENKRGGFACQFLRANDLAEFTTNPENHGDTEYHYNLSWDGLLLAYELKRDWEDETKSVQKLCYFNGHVVDFVNNYLKLQGKDKFAVHGYQIKTIVEFEKEIETKYTECLKLLIDGHIGNAGYAVSELRRLSDFLGGYYNKSIQKLDEMITKEFAK